METTAPPGEPGGLPDATAWAARETGKADRRPPRPRGGSLPKLRTTAAEAFGTRLATLHMVAYYEGPDAHPPANLLPTIAQVLTVSLDQLLGVVPVKKTAAVGSTRLARRLQELEKLDPKDKRQVLQLLDAFLERERLKRKMQTRPTT